MNPFPEIDAIAIVKELLSAAVHNKSRVELPAMSEDEWFYILGVCAAQDIHTLVFDYLPQVIPEKVYARWAELAQNNAARFRTVSAVVAAQEKAWKKYNLNYSLLKGESIALLYPHPEHRGCGDIDWYFSDERSREIAEKCAAKNSSDGLKQDSDGDFHYNFNGVTIEHHKEWSHLSSKKLRKLAGKPQVNNGRLSAEDTLLVLETHLLHHLAYCGLGLKQFADLADAFIRLDGQYDKNSFAERLERLGLTQWAMLVHSAIVKLTGISSDLLPVPPSSNSGETETLISIVFSDGCVPVGRKFSFRILLIRANLMWKVSKIECFARYFNLIIGKMRLLAHK